jgi:hypothetical protein
MSGCLNARLHYLSQMGLIIPAHTSSCIAVPSCFYDTMPNTPCMYVRCCRAFHVACRKILTAKIMRKGTLAASSELASVHALLYSRDHCQQVGDFIIMVPEWECGLHYNS